MDMARGVRKPAKYAHRFDGDFGRDLALGVRDDRAATEWGEQHQYNGRYLVGQSAAREQRDALGLNGDFCGDILRLRCGFAVDDLGDDLVADGTGKGWRARSGTDEMVFRHSFHTHRFISLRGTKRTPL